MSAAKHTPGTWLMDDEGAIYADGKLVATVNVRKVGTGPDAWDWDTAGADGALICAAPKMLLALDAAHHALMSFAHGNASEEFARDMAARCAAVIAEATP